MVHDAPVRRPEIDALRALPRSRRWLLRSAVGAGIALPMMNAFSASSSAFQSQPDYFGFTIEPTGQDGGTAIIQMPGETSSLYPLTYDGYFSGSTWGYGGLVWESLIAQHPVSGEFVPLLAESWEVSTDGLVWTFHLRTDAVWHDGTPFTSADVVFSYESAQTPDVNSFWGAMMTENIASIEAPDDHTVVMTATSVNAEFLEVGTMYLAAAHVWKDVPPAEIVSHAGATGADPSLVIGTGPFKFVERVQEDHVTVVRNEEFRRGRPHIERMIFQYLDTTAAEPLLRTGEVDYSWVTFQGGNQFRELDSVTLHEYYSLDLVCFGQNMDPEKSTLFQDKRVRQALLYAIDREVVAEAGYNGFATAAETVLLPGMWSHNPEGITVTYTYDPEKAGQLLDEAGWVMGDDGVRVKDGQRFSFPFIGQEFWDGPQLIVQEFWREIGVEMEIQNLSWEALGERVESFDFEMTVDYFNCRGSGFDGMSEVITANYPTGGNYTKFSNPRIDELYEQLKTELDPAKRIVLFTEFQNVFLDELPGIPLVHDFDVRVSNNRLHNLYPNTYNAVFNAETWWLEA